MHVYLYTSTVYTLHIMYLQKSMNTSDKNNENNVKINENFGTMNENQ